MGEKYRKIESELGRERQEEGEDEIGRERQEERGRI